MWRDLALVALGGALGAIARFGVASGLGRMAFPWATTLVNLSGSLAMGWLVLPQDLAPGPRLFIATGFLGAFTTMSAFSVDMVSLLRGGRHLAAVSYLALNALGAPLLAFVGWRIGAQ